MSSFNFLHILEPRAGADSGGLGGALSLHISNRFPGGVQAANLMSTPQVARRLLEDKELKCLERGLGTKHHERQNLTLQQQCLPWILKPFAKHLRGQDLLLIVFFISRLGALYPHTEPLKSTAVLFGQAGGEV